MGGGTGYSHGRVEDFTRTNQGAGAVPVRELDVTGLLDQMARGEEVIVLATDPASVIDFKHFCNTTDNALIAHETRPHPAHGALFVYHIRRGG
jgi:tRNA 2-thiouridine synthesizing protein A